MHLYKKEAKIILRQIKSNLHLNTSNSTYSTMAYKFVVLAACLVAVRAGLAPATIAAPAIAYSSAPAVSSISYSSPIVSYGTPIAAQTPTITSQSQNILRSFGNLGQISTYSKTLDTPFSSVRKTDVRVSNPGLRYTSSPVIAAPAFQAAYAAPAVAPAAVTYSAAPAVSHVSYQGIAGSYVF
ncbi:pupal cuticle protein C1B-like [Aethina tumida]|uniref:pupal cuticle protein C1B-like n=1 Tax=Aethina tumida TaxID=116153 RepID=UPI002147748B|nr:pupal cuticle protein C1B-like [Aethina tumida]